MTTATNPTTSAATYTIREPGCTAWQEGIACRAEAEAELMTAHDRGLRRARIYAVHGDGRVELVLRAADE